MKNKKVLVIARFSVQNFKVSVESWKLHIVQLLKTEKIFDSAAWKIPLFLGLEQCPFCPFATIMDTKPDENKIFICQNPDCGKESCRLCKEISHIPLRCEEVEKDAEVRKRTYIENKMTEAMIRKCWKCSKPFVKMDGCNKMTCDCGASMCYLCRQPVKDYKHFYGQGNSQRRARKIKKVQEKKPREIKYLKQ